MNPSVVSGDHADVHLERAVVRWLAELVGYPHAPGAGLLTSGASAATIVCLAGARGRTLVSAGHDVRRDGLAGAPQLTAYMPAEAHSCVRRALELLGLGSDAMREVPLNEASSTPPRCLVDRGRSRERGPARAARRLRRHRQHRRDRPARCARRCGDRRAGLVPRRRRVRRVRGARPGDRVPLPRHGTGRLAGPRSAQVAGRARRRRLRAGAARRRPTRRVQRHPAIPYARTPAPRSARSPSTGSSRQGPSAPLKPGRPSLRSAAPASPPRWPARTPSPASWRRSSSASPSWSWRPRRDLHRRLPRPPGGLPARGAGRAQSRAAGGVQARGRAFVTGTVLDSHETLRACILHPDTARSTSRPSWRRCWRPPGPSWPSARPSAPAHSTSPPSPRRSTRRPAAGALRAASGPGPRAPCRAARCLGPSCRAEPRSGRRAGRAPCRSPPPPR